MQVHRQDREVLRRGIVQLARNAAALIVLQFEKPAGELVQRGFNTLPLAAVRARSHVTKHLSILADPGRAEILQPAIFAIRGAKTVIQLKAVARFYGR